MHVELAYGESGLLLRLDDGWDVTVLDEHCSCPCRSIEVLLDQVLRERPASTICVMPEGPQAVPYLSAG